MCLRPESSAAATASLTALNTPAFHDKLRTLGFVVPDPGSGALP
jgi:hypothetical protein